MEFVVNESGCKLLCEDMQALLNNIKRTVDNIESKDGTLKAALGNDYDVIASLVKVMKNELDNADIQLGVIISNMNDYIARVHSIRVILNN